MGALISVPSMGSRHSEQIEGLTADDFLYEVGSGSVVPELDEQLRGAKPGDILKFNATPPGQEEDVSFQVLVKDVKEKILPEVTDEWAGEASEFDTVDELRADISSRMALVKRMQAQMSLRNGTAEALVELVSEEPPEPLANQKLGNRINALGQH